MVMRKTPFAIGEWYHCYNRGVDKRTVFTNAQDYYRFLELLYLANDEFSFRREDLGKQRKFKEILSVPRGKNPVAIAAFCLMPNHFHLVLKEKIAGGITAFMRKLGTAYAMYFNARNERTGNIFLRPFRSRHIATDRYFQHLINYVHSNPAALSEPGWKTGTIVDSLFIGEQAAAYPYSSLSAYTNAHSPLRAILDTEAFSIVRVDPIQKMLQGARQYYGEHPDLP